MKVDQQRYQGGYQLCLQVYDEKLGMKVDMQSFGNGFEMNDELTHFLIGKPEMEVAVEVAG